MFLSIVSSRVMVDGTAPAHARSRRAARLTSEHALFGAIRFAYAQLLRSSLAGRMPCGPTSWFAGFRRDPRNVRNDIQAQEVTHQSTVDSQPPSNRATTSRLEVVRNRALLTLTLGHFTVDMYSGVLPILYPLLTQEFDLNLKTVGLVSLAYSGAASRPSRSSAISPTSAAPG